MFNKESSLFVNSGTQSNLIAMMTHCQRKYESCIVGDKSHILNLEGGSLSSMGGIQPYVMKMDSNGEFDLDELERTIPAFNAENLSQPRVISLENSVSMQGGKVVSMDYLARVREIANRHSLKLHLDGSRLFNALVYLEKEIEDVSPFFDSISLGLTRGLGCPMGSMLISNAEFIHDAKYRRKMIGGGMRQSGMMSV